MADTSNYGRKSNTSQNLTNPKRLSFEFLNSTEINTQDKRDMDSGKKRKLNDSSIYSVVDETIFNNRTVNETFNSTGSSIAGSIAPWETKMLRIDLLEMQTQVAQYKKEIQHQTTIQTELELKFVAKEKSLESELNQFKNKASELERVLKKNRKNENQMKEELVKVNNQLLLQKQTFDQSLFKLNNENKGLKETLSYKTNSFENKISEITKELNEAQSLQETFERELKSTREINEDLLGKLEVYKTVKGDLEQEKNKYQDAAMKIKELEYIVNSYGDWKEVEKAATSRMSSMSEIEKEVTRLRQVNKNLNESLGNKLLLEEKVLSLQTRVERYEQSSEDQVTLKTKIESLEKELTDWHQLGSDFVPKGNAPNPINVRSYIEKLLYRDLHLVSEKSSASSEKSCIESELSDLRMKNETLTRQSENMEKSLKTHQSIVLKLQKKMKLVMSERDSQRQLLDSYEKDLTVNPGGAASSNALETQTRIRLEMLTNSLAGYKELCARLEQENANLRGNPSLVTDSTTFGSSDQFRALRKDLDSLRMDNDKLRKRNCELEIEIENLTLRNNCVGDDERLKVLHFKNNPASIAQEQVAEEVSKLKAEVERLKVRNRKLEEGNQDLTMRINETMNMTLGVKDLQKVKEEYIQLQAKFLENEKIFMKVNQDLREVVSMLFGYKLDRYGNNNYRITSMYADQETDELIFQLNDEGHLDMLETEYSKMLHSLVGKYLQGPNGSLPSFTAALTIDLVNRMTVVS